MRAGRSSQRVFHGTRWPRSALTGVADASCLPCLEIQLPREASLALRAGEPLRSAPLPATFPLLSFPGSPHSMLLALFSRPIARVSRHAIALLIPAPAALPGTPSAADGFDPNSDGNIWAVATQADG